MGEWACEVEGACIWQCTHTHTHTHLVGEHPVALPQPPVLRRQSLSGTLKLADVLLQFPWTIPSDLNCALWDRERGRVEECSCV